MRRILSILIMLTLVLTIAGCKKSSQEPPKGLTPVETIQYYFEQWNNKNPVGMHSVYCDSVKVTIFEERLALRGLRYVKLNSCVLDDSHDRSKWYPDAYSCSVVVTEFEINFRSGHSDSIANGTFIWRYWLIKETSDSDWRLIQWGAC